MRVRVIALPLIASACGYGTFTKPVAEPTTTVVVPEYASPPATVVETTHASSHEEPSLDVLPSTSTDDHLVLLLPSTHIDRLSEVIRVLDVHMDSGDEALALATLRRNAAALGADAVLGVEFHHGEEGGPTHLSGIAVRFLSALPNR